MSEDEFERELARVDDEFSALASRGPLSPGDLKRYWQRLDEAHKRHEQQVTEANVHRALDTHFRVKGCYVANMGRGMFWLRPPEQRGLDFQHLVSLDARLPATRRLRSIRVHHGGFVLLIR